VSPCQEHIKKEGNKSELENQEEGEEIAKRASMELTHNGSVATTVLWEGRQDADFSQRSRCNTSTICDYYSLYGVSLVPTRNSIIEAFLRMHRIDKL